MSENRTPPADWVVPAIIVGTAVALFIVMGIVIAFTADDQSENSGLVYELDVYTSCLASHGANVPIVEARKNGGFSVVVPGSLVDGDVDNEPEGEIAFRRTGAPLFGQMPVPSGL